VSLLIRNATLVDPAGKLSGKSNLLLDKGKIAAIG
jgi:predicted amidohydrolase